VLASTSTNVATCLSQQAHLQVFLNQDFDKVAETSAGHTATLQEIFDEVQGVKRSLGDIHKKLEETDGAIKTVSVLSSPTQAITAARVTADVRTLQDHFDNGLVEMDDKLEAIRKMLDKSSNVHNNAPTSLALSSQTESWQVGATVKASLEEWFKAATVDPDHPLNLILCSQVSTAIATSQSFKQEVDLAQLQRSYQTTADRLGDANAQLESLRKDKSQALEKLATFNTRVVQLVEKSETRMRTQLAHLVTFILELARAHGGLLEDYAFTLAGERQQRNALRDWLNAGEYSPQSNEERLESIHRIVEEILDGLWHTQTLGTVKQVEVDIVSKAEVRLRDVLGDDHNDVMKLCRSGLL
jgi:prefoldin subunit 5